MGIKHAFTNPKSDGGDATVTRPSDWNADHTITGLGLAFIGAKAITSGTSNSTNAVFSSVAFGTEIFDTDGFHDNSTNNSRFTIPAGLGGKYLVQCGVEWDTNTSGERLLAISVNGSPVVYSQRASAANTLTQSGSFILDLIAGDYVETQVYQNSGNTRTVGAANGVTNMEIAKLDSGKVGTGIGASANRTTQQTPITTQTAILFDAEAWDTDGFHSTGSNTDRMTIPSGLGGKYVVTGYTYVTAVAAGKYVHIRCTKNGLGTTLFGDRHAVSPDLNDVAAITGIVDLVAGDYLLLTVESDDASFAVESGSTFSIMRLDSGSVVDSGKELDYKELASPLGLTATSEGTAQTVIASNTFTCDGAPIWAEFFASRVDYNAGAVGRAIVFDVYLDSTMKGRIAHTASSVASTNVIRGVYGKVRMTPSSGGHTVTIKTWFSNAADSATVDANAGGTGQTVPTFLAITKV